MTNQNSTASWFYRQLARLYPPQFHQEFGEEMISVFEEAASDACQGGFLALLRTCAFEYTSLIQSAVGMRLAGEADKSATASWEGPPRRLETALVMGIFLLPALSVALYGKTGSPWLLVVLGLVVGAIVLAGIAKGLPRWSLPALGLVLAGISFISLYQWAANLSAGPALARYGLHVTPGSERLLLQAVWAGFMWLGLFAASAAALWLLSLLRKAHLLLARLQQDWTSASYVFYSGAVVTLTLAFSEHRHQPGYAYISTLCLAAGAWLYLHSPQPWQRLLALISGATLAMGASAAGLLPSIPVRELSTWLLSQPADSGFSKALGFTLMEWGWIVLAIIIPALLKLTPRITHQERS